MRSLRRPDGQPRRWLASRTPWLPVQVSRRAVRAVTEIDIEAIRARAVAASEGPWVAITDNGRKNGIGIVGQESKRGTGEAIAVFAGADSTQRNADARFAAHAREDVPALLDVLDRAEWACVRCGYHNRGWGCTQCGRPLVVTAPKAAPVPQHPFESGGPGGTCNHAFDPEFKHYCGLPSAHEAHGMNAGQDNTADGSYPSEANRG